MKDRTRSTTELVNGIVLNVFKLNGLFVKAADDLTRGSDLTSARWQVLGAVLHEQLTVAAIARSMGLARQSVQRVADVLVADGLAEYHPNPAHKRAKLLSSTQKGFIAIQMIRPGVDAWAAGVKDLVGVSELEELEQRTGDLLSKLLRAEEDLLKSG